MEIFDLFDINRIPTNKTMIRGNKIPIDSYRQVVHVAVFNKAGDKMLIQKRLKTKNPWPGRWDFSCGGSVIAGETSREGAQRELFEEIGIKYNFENLRPLFTYNFPNGFNDFYAISLDVEPQKLKLQETEVECVKWATKEEIFEIIDKGEFIPFLKSLFNFIFDLNKFGSIRPDK